ncbi:MAG TPA: hypothetical protein VE443_09980, partial [Beijerinckiaceae bacterium]|nr:hypothetical protein [Beijerinckiaceae bacterium]
FGFSLQSDEQNLLTRFGLTPSPGGALRLVDTGLLDDLLPGFSRALAVQPASRRDGTSASPDGLLLRLSAHDAYRASSQKAAIRAVATMPPGAGLLVELAQRGARRALGRAHDEGRVAPLELAAAQNRRGEVAGPP